MGTVSLRSTPVPRGVRWIQEVIVHMDLTTLISSIPSAAISLVVAVLICFMGYRLRKAGIMLAGALLGYTIAHDIAARYADASTALLIGLVVGVLLALMCSWLYDAGIFILCGACGALYVGSLIEQFAMIWWVELIILLAAFIAVGVLALQFVRPVLIIVSGLAGASSILSSLALLGLPLPAGNVRLVCALVLALVGMAVQFTTTHGR